MTQNAREAGLSHLYHYENFNPDYLADVLKKQRVHCSDPSNLNDPWDCRPWFRGEALDDPTALEAFMDWLLSHEPTSPVTEEQTKVFRAALRTDPSARKRILENFSKDFLKVIAGRWRIYCLTPIPDSTLMWSHYADNHRGICLEFGTESAVFGFAQKVRYLSSYPEWAPHSLVTSASSHEILLTKSDAWTYESEYRVIALAEGINRPFKVNLLELSGNYLGLPAGSLQAVILGCESDHEPISNLVKEIAPGLKIKRVVRAVNEYKLEMVERLGR